MTHTHHSHETTHSIGSGQADTTIFGFWLYLMSDCLLFASLFATFAVLRDNTFGGPSGRELFSLSFVFLETIILLTSSFTCGLSYLAMRQGRTDRVLIALLATFVLGASFVALELSEFAHLYIDGNGWQRSGAMSAFFTLVGTHGLHVSIGLLWMLVLGVQLALKGLTLVAMKRLVLFNLFWHFLDIVWIFIFTIVYLMGAI